MSIVGAGGAIATPAVTVQLNVPVSATVPSHLSENAVTVSVYVPLPWYSP